MANVLKMTIVQSILSLPAQGWSQRRIAAQLGIDRETVSGYIRLARSAVQPDPSDLSKPAIAPIDPARTQRVPAADSNPAPVPIGSASAGRRSHGAPWREYMLAKHGQGLSAQRIHQDLRAQSGTERISYDSVRRFLKRVGAVRVFPVWLPRRKASLSSRKLPAMLRKNCRSVSRAW